VDADGTVARSDAVEAGVMAVSAPVFDATGAVVAAVSVVGPAYRVSRNEPAIRSAVAEAASSLSA
ncbi:MAG TPA: IclR family transcriptional regulator, partial [Acidimicrobiaceae bacterium]|nr:IclR family transcriptional regulator [Acidimicrobiaceae bacterium]